jgi:hypothetical protein
LDQLVRDVIYRSEPASTAFPSDFHKDLKGLLVKLINSHLAEWREVAANSQVGPAKLVDFGNQIITQHSIGVHD